ncbi:MAG: DUF2802 domain-containing protein [Thiogranum sp.]|nr:DUF2802 domain-containing protein [Thiogranum sp.]
MTILLLNALAVTLIAGLAALGYLYLRATRARQEIVETLRQSQLRVQQVEQELGALCRASLSAGDHVVTLERQVERLIERQNHLEMRAASERPYGHASELVHKGANIKELVDSCGLTHGEAELLVMMQRGVA